MTDRRDDDFRIRPSAPKNRGQSFVSKVLKQAGKASSGKSAVRRPGGSSKSAGSGQRPGSRLGRGHTAARFAGAAAQRNGVALRRQERCGVDAGHRFRSA